MRDPSCAYSDTDSVFTRDTLGIFKTGEDIGMFKDELEGKIIKNATFLVNKQYGYTFEDNGKIIEK